jgi:hypothetical protein
MIGRMSQKTQWVVGAVVLAVLVAAAIWAAVERESGITVVLVAVILIGAVALSVVVSRKQS